MKTLLTIFTLVFTVMFSSTSFGGWTKVGEGVDGTTFYVDFARIRKHGGYVYYWELSDFLKPDKYENLSLKLYFQGDCNLFRYKILSNSQYNQPMGKGDKTGGSNKPDKEWRYPSPNSVEESVLKSVCSR